MLGLLERQDVPVVPRSSLLDGMPPFAKKSEATERTVHTSMRRSASYNDMATQRHEPRGARIPIDDGALDVLRMVIQHDQRTVAQDLQGTAKHGVYAVKDALATPLQSRNYVQREQLTVADKSDNPSMTISPRLLFPESPTTPRTPLSPPELEGNNARRPSAVSSSEGSLPTTPDLSSSLMRGIPALSVPGLENARLPRLGSPISFEERKAPRSRQPQVAGLLFHRPDPSSLALRGLPSVSSHHDLRPSPSALAGGHGHQTHAVHVSWKLSAPAMTPQSLEPVKSPAAERVTRLPRTSSHGALRALPEPVVKEPLRDAVSSSRRTSFFGGFTSLKSLKRRDSAASNSTATSTQTWTSTSSYRTTTSSHGRAETLHEVDEDVFGDEESSVKSKGSNRSLRMNSKAMTLLGLDPNSRSTADERGKRARAHRQSSMPASRQEWAIDAVRLADLMPCELASDTLFTHMPTTTSSKSLIRASKTRWHLRFILLAQDWDASPVLHQFRSPPASADVELGRLQLTNESKVYVPEEDGLLAPDIGHALRVTGINTQDGSSISWTLGMETSEQMSKWLKILKEAVFRLRQSDERQSARHYRADISSVSSSPMRSVRRVDTQTSLQQQNLKESGLPYSSDRTKAGVVEARAEARDVSRKEEEYFDTETENDQRPQFRHPFAIWSAQAEDTSQNEPFAFEEFTSPPENGPLSPTQVALGTYYATWHGGIPPESMPESSRVHKRLSIVSRQSVPEPPPAPAHDLPLPPLPPRGDLSRPDAHCDTFDSTFSLPTTLRRLSVNTSATTTSASSCTSSLRSRLSSAPLPPPKLPPPSTALPPIPSSHTIT
ncbi:hypothetical protein OIV83_004640 [Microbotryomycetes sp. JL201]|nr:hypothetical protein OIV83_004640 [Microbotryomycetes sp. JL201]